MTAPDCRPDQLLGVWAIEASRFAPMVTVAKSADLVALRQAAQATARLPAAPLYQVVDGLAVVGISGPMTKRPTSFSTLIGGTATIRTREAIRDAARDPSVKGIMLIVDSPGGTVAGTADLAQDIRAAATKKPLHGYVEDLAASAALWAVSAASQVHANATAEVGSIGTYMVVEDTSKAYAQEGIKVHVVSSAPPHKGAGVPGTEITAEQLGEWKRRIDDINAMFVAEVATLRRMPLERARSLATGQSWIAAKAVSFGLIDGIASLDEAMETLRKEAMQTRVEGQPTRTREVPRARRATAYERVRAIARAKIDSGKARTLTEAIEATWKENPDLYREHMAERDGTRRDNVTTTTAYGKAQELAYGLVGRRAKTMAEAFDIVWAEEPDLYRQHMAERG